MPTSWPDVMALFEAVLEQPPDERDAWLVANCDDPQLRAEVEHLLAAHERPDGILDEPLYPPSEDPALASPESADGQRIGPYRTVRLLGHGGMGSVYLAERADGQFDQQVALKLLRTGFDSEDRTQRFLAERQILATLNHPNIARLLDGGVTEADRPFFVMEYVDGQPLDRYCDVQQLSIRERLELFLTVCKAVQYAHRNLIVHRDLKPSNILVTDAGTVKLLDFGIAKLLDPEALPSHAAPRTRTGLLPMTPAYASPEQVRGEPITTASDVYQLGVVLYELLTGYRPYRLQGRTPSEIERIICEEEPTRPSTAVTQVSSTADDVEATPEQISQARKTKPEQLQKRLQGDIDTIVLKALRKEPDRRYDSAEQLAEDLERHLAGRPVAAHADTWTYRTRKFVQRHRWGVATAAAFLVLLVGYALTVTWQAQRIQTALDRAQQETEKSEQVTEFMMNLFEAGDPSEALGDTVTARELLARGVERAEALDDQPAVQAQMFNVMGRVYQHLGRYDQAQPLLERALTMRREQFGAEHLETAESLNNLALLLHQKGAYEEAEPLYREALAIRRRLLGTEHSAVAESMNNLALLLLRKGDYEASESFYRKSLAINRKVLGERHPELTASLSGLAMVLRAKGNHDAAEPLLREALAIDRRELGEVHPDVATTLNNLGLVLTKKGELSEAEPLLREALAMRRKLLGREHPRVATTLNNLASLLHRKKDYDAAEPLFREALAINRKLLGERHPRVAAGMGNLGQLLRDKGQYAEAEPLLQEALSRLQTFLGEDHPYIERARKDLVKLYDAWGKPDSTAKYRALLADDS